MTDNQKKLKSTAELPDNARNKFSKARWEAFLRLIANGITVADALKDPEVDATRQTYETHLAVDKNAVQQLKTAQQSWWRRDWPLEKIEDVLVHIALGKTMDEAFEEEFIDKRDQHALYRLLLKDPSLRQLYDEAREMQAEKWADDIIQISDDGRNDKYEVESKSGNVYEKTDHDVIKRSQLRVASRQWIMARTHHQRFGDKIKQEIEQKVEVNHAEQLTKARQRREKAHKEGSKLKKKAASELVAQQAPQVPPTQH